jgi:hypothetical protein
MRPSRSGGRVPFGTSFLYGAPIASQGGPLNLQWTYTGPAVDHWIIESSTNGLPPWSFVDNPDGSTTNDSVPTAGLYYRLTGYSLTNVQLTETSNIVHIT